MIQNSCRRWALLLAVALLLIASLVVPYRPIGYRVYSVHEQHLKPGIWTDNAMEHSPNYGIEYRKRFTWIPGPYAVLADISDKGYRAYAEKAISAYEWDTEADYGKAYFFAPNPTHFDGSRVPSVPLATAEQRLTRSGKI